MSLGTGLQLRSKKDVSFESSSSMSFDGTDDVVSTNVAVPDISSASMCYWVKRKSTGALLSGVSDGSRFYLGYSATSGQVWGGVGATIQSNSGDEVPLDVWSHLALVANSGTISVYLNGVLQASKAHTGSTPTSTIHIGAPILSSGVSFTYADPAEIDEFAIFSSALTAREVDAIYNNGRPGSLLHHATLHAHYRMGEGTLTGGKRDGDDNLLFDQSTNGGLGSELVTNGTFDTDVSGWSAAGNGALSYQNGVLRVTTSGGAGSANQVIALSSGATFTLTFDVVAETQSSGTPFFQVTSGLANTSITSTGTQTIVVTASSDNPTLTFSLGGAATNGEYIEIDNVSVKEIQNVGTISGATVIPDEGAELVTNGGFDTDSNWTTGSGFTISGGKATRVIGQNSDLSQTLNAPLVTGAQYKISFNAEDTSGNTTFAVRLKTPGEVESSFETRGANNVIFLTASNAHTVIDIRPGGSSTGGAVDNISLQEVTNGVPLQVQNLAPVSRGQKSLSFDGSDDVVEVSSLTTLSGASQFTLSGWFNKADAGHPLSISYTQNSSHRTSINFHTDSKVYFNLAAGGANYGEFALASTNWVHLAMVYDGNSSGNAARLKGYLDGVEQTLTFNSTIPATAHSQSAIFRIGKDQANGVFSQGGISDVAVWDTALSASAVKALYNAGKSTHLTVNTGAFTYKDNLQAYYKMGSGTVPVADGTSNLLFDQTSPGVGSERVRSDSEVYQAGAWVPYSTNSVTYPNGTAMRVLHPASGGSAAGALTRLSSSATPLLQSDFAVGTVVKVSVDFLTDDSNAYVRVQTPISGTVDSSVGSGTKEFFVTIGSPINSNFLYFQHIDAGKFAQVSNISVRSVNGHTGTISGASVVDNNVPRQIYALPPLNDNTRSLILDGTNDHLVTQVDATAQPNNESRYISWWSKSTKTTSNAVWDHGDSNIGAFRFNHDSGRPILYMADSVLRYWVDTPCQDDGAWHHWTVRIKYNDLTGCELWCDGVKQAVSADANSGSMNTYTTGIRIGRAGTGYFSGSIDSFCIWGEVSNPEEFARALFNAGRPINPSKSLGAANQPELLEHWWRMGDASHDGNADGTNDILFQGFSEEGSELITGFTNGSTYPFDTLVTSGRDITSAIETSGNLGAAVSNSFSIQTGEVYKVTFNLTYNSGTNTVNVGLRSDATGANVNLSNIYNTNTNGVNEVLLTATGEDSTAHLQFQLGGYSNSVNFSATDISVKRLRGQYTGLELVKADADLYTDATWTIYNANVETFPGGTAARFFRPTSGGSSAGGVTYLAAGTGSHALTENMETGCVYKLQFDFITDDSDAFPRYYNGSAYTTLPSGSGTKVLYFVYSGSTGTLINASDLTADKFVQFSNLSVTKIGAAAVLTNMDSASDIQTDTPY